jgi:hypothetical protein
MEARVSGPTFDVLDATDIRGDPVSRMWAYDANALDAFGSDSSGLITQFNPAPEPSTVFLGIALLLMACYVFAKSTPTRKAYLG